VKCLPIERRTSAMKIEIREVEPVKATSWSWDGGPV
jgi:hypothetical protein